VTIVLDLPARLVLAVRTHKQTVGTDPPEESVRVMYVLLRRTHYSDGLLTIRKGGCES